MWFKQLGLFRLNPDALPDLAKLESGMEQHGFASPGGLEWSSQGFVAPAGHAPDRLLHPLAGGALVALKREDKVLPAA
ncbi:recombination-associated protein RdgC, partial [Laribacter hongkongensis]|uniref:recombination-associated protein RdgC n=1 Tax=Laribacter hongkongensis TaxID=168471 RepID=UPI001877979B